jgi:hypothetical protein
MPMLIGIVAARRFELKGRWVAIPARDGGLAGCKKNGGRSQVQEAAYGYRFHEQLRALTDFTAQAGALLSSASSSPRTVFRNEDNNPS